MPATAAQLTIAAASDLAYCIDDIVAAYRAQAPGVTVKVSLGASGTLFAQVKNGAPFDVFMSADMAYPARLAQEGAADKATLAPYARGHLALWTTDPKLDPAAGIRIVMASGVKRVAIANPDVAPYGKAARDALVAAGLWGSVAPRLVMGENVAQAAQFVQTGNAQVGLVPLSLLLSPRLVGVGRHAVLPATTEQGAVVTRRGSANPEAARFASFLRSARARAVFARHGFAPAGGDR